MTNAVYINNPQTIAGRGFCGKFEVTTNQITMSNLSNSAQELWLPISGLPFYEISNFGRVRSLARHIKGPYDSIRIMQDRILKPCCDNHGYPIKHIAGKTYKIHRLVALEFIPNPRNCKEVNHIDGNKLNNRVDNLEWSTRSENMKHAINTGLAHPANFLSRCFNPRNTKKVLQVSLEGELLKEWSSIKEAANSFNAKGGSLITSVCRKKKKTAYGFNWLYC